MARPSSSARPYRTATSSCAAAKRFLEFQARHPLRRTPIIRPETAAVLSPRQALLLGKVVDGFARTGQPVGSKTLAADPDITAGSATIRNELAVLEERGLLAHPHTSAGRVPTDAGYRYFVDRLLPATREHAEPTVHITLGRRE